MPKNQQVLEVADLACLKLNPQEAESFQQHFDKVMEYFKNLNEVNTEGVEPMVTPHNQFPDLRGDEVARDLTVDEVLANAPEVKDNLFKVPPVV